MNPKDAKKNYSSLTKAKRNTDMTAKPFGGIIPLIP